MTGDRATAAVRDADQALRPLPERDGRVPWSALLSAAGVLACLAALVAHPSQAGSAAAQAWPPFVLVAGLLLIGLVAADDGLFVWSGRWLATSASSSWTIYAGAVVLITGVTAVLNLDTSVAFLTPVLVYAARSRGEGEAALLYGCLLLSNAASSLLPGANLTNLVVLGHDQPRGHLFLARMGPACLAAVTVTAVVIAVAERRSLHAAKPVLAPPEPPTIGLGAVAVLGAVVQVLVVPSPALPVAAIGVAAVAIRVAQGRARHRHVMQVLGIPTLVGLFGVAVALGTVGRVWSWPVDQLSHLDRWATAAVAALTALLVNNLPAASLLAARAPRHPFALLVGLNVGPNLFVTGSLSWLLWLRAARTVGSRPSIRRASILGLIAVPVSMAAALAVLIGTGVS